MNAKAAAVYATICIFLEARTTTDKNSASNPFSMHARISGSRSAFVHVTAGLVSLLTLTTHFARAEETTTTMKAVRIHSYGEAEVLKYEDAPRPEPKEDEILVRVFAASVNPVDAKVRQGHFKPPGAQMPLIIGYDISGVVEKPARRRRSSNLATTFTPTSR